jgi:excisionase family DNA binding protein
MDISNLNGMTVKEFCDQFRISKSHFYKLLKQGAAPAITKLGSRTIILSGDIQAWVEKIKAAHGVGSLE